MRKETYLCGKTLRGPVEQNGGEMKSGDEKTIKQKEENEMRCMNDDKGKPCPDTSLTRRHTATARLCSAESDVTAAVCKLKIKIVF